jgi:hypothetical protein
MKTAKIVQNDGLAVIERALYHADGYLNREVSHLYCHLSLIPDLKCPVLLSGGFGSMIKIIDKASCSACHFLFLTTLANCLEDTSTLCHLPSIENTVKMVLMKMTDVALCVRREAHRALTNLLSSAEAASIAISLNFLTSMNASLISCDDHIIHLSAALSLHKLSVDASNHEYMIQCAEGLNMIAYLCRLWKGSKETLIHAGTALRNLSTNDDMKELIASKGGLTVALSLLSYDCEEVHAVAISVLYHLSFPYNVKYDIYIERVLLKVCKIVAINLKQSKYWAAK